MADHFYFIPNDDYVRLSKMDILLINPPYTALKGLASEHGYSINLVSLATYRVSNGLNVKVQDTNFLNYPFL